ncbi:MAG: FtsX-like permease family protein, partial [Tannerellaceae bacterium]|nr:FtsX-like permease family protein [Tannerellaceae bacterium]
FKEIFWLYREGLYSKVIFVPLKEFYFSDFSEKSWYGVLQGGDYIFVLALMSMGILILIFAIINYTNLTVAQTGFRAKEMATRRLLGSSRGELFMRLILESTVLTLISFAIAVFAAFLFAPFVSELLQRKLELVSFISPYTILISLLLILLFGGSAGLLPATLISNAKPVDVVKGAFRTQTKMVFSKIFITFQNLITISLIALALLVVWQTYHLIHAPLGYPTHGRIVIDVEDLSQENIGTLRNEFSQLASVKAVACSQSSPFEGGNNLTTNYNGVSIGFQRFVADPAFVEMYDIQILRENNLSDSKGLYLSERALMEMGETMDLEYVTTSHEFFCFPVAGVIKDLVLYNITLPPKPMTWDIRKAEDFEWGIWTLTVQTQGDHWAAYKQVKDIYEKVTRQEFTGEFIEKQISETFAPQKRLSRIVSLFAGVAIIISLLGITGYVNLFRATT